MTRRLDPSPVVTLLDHAVAVAQIADHISARSHYLIPIGPTAASKGMYSHYRGIAINTIWLDNGTGQVARLNLPGNAPPGVVRDLLAAVTSLAPMAAVMAAVKSEANARAVASLTQAAGQNYDSQQDLIMALPEAGAPFEWTVLFVEAIAQVDPAAAAQIYASDVSGLS